MKSAATAAAKTALICFSLGNPSTARHLLLKRKFYPGRDWQLWVAADSRAFVWGIDNRASNEGYPKVRNHGEAATTAFTFKTLLRRYADPTVSQREIGSAMQRSEGTGDLVSIVSYSRPSLMIIASRTQFHIERPWGQRPFSIVS